MKSEGSGGLRASIGNFANSGVFIADLSPSFLSKNL